MQRHYFANKGPSSQSYDFSSSYVWMWELDHKEGWVPKNWCFWTVVWEKTLESPLARRSNQSILKEINPQYSKNKDPGIQSHHFMTNIWETIEIVTEFLFLGSKITVDGDCSHEIKRHLLLERKAMTNLGSILKSRGITLPTKVHLVKAMVFPVIMYGCESWTIKKAECQKTDAFELWCWRRLLRIPWTARDPTSPS